MHIKEVVTRLGQHVRSRASDDGVRALARESGVSKSTISKLIIGETETLTIENIKKIAATTRRLAETGNPLTDSDGHPISFSDLELVAIAAGLQPPAQSPDAVSVFIRGVLANQGFNPFQKTGLSAGIEFFLEFTPVGRLSESEKARRFQRIEALIRGNENLSPDDSLMHPIAIALKKITGETITPLMLRSLYSLKDQSASDS